MPIVRVMNWPCKVNQLGRDSVSFDRCLKEALLADNEFKRLLCDDLRRAVVSARISLINSVDSVTVSFDSGHVCPPWFSQEKHGKDQLSDDRRLIIFVEGLYDRSDRTRKDRGRLATMLLKAACTHLPDDWKAEVFVTSFNTNEDICVGSV